MNPLDAIKTKLRLRKVEKHAVELLEALAEDAVEVYNAVADVPIVIHSKPTAYEIELGAEPDDCGLYIAPSPAAIEYDTEGDLPDPTIYLYADNLEPPTRETVWKTLLHEIGHALQMEEWEVEALGLA